LKKIADFSAVHHHFLIPTYSLQVFQQNQPALGLYQKLGFQPQWLGMVKPLRESGSRTGLD
jgi:ribosomal protein S18 acetylase RimI-like enzyme